MRSYVYMGFGVLWVAGVLKYVMWTEQAAKDLRREGLLKDILREEKRVKACKDCDIMNQELIDKLQVRPIPLVVIFYYYYELRLGK